MDKAILAVATKCSDPSRLEEFEHWYLQEHFADVLTVDHFDAARLYRAAGTRPPVGQVAADGVDFLAIYEMDTRNVDAAMDLLWKNDERVKALNRNPHLYIPILSHTYVAISERMTKQDALMSSPLPALKDANNEVNG